jgi:cytochrome c-type biogenesis protein CcsB
MTVTTILFYIVFLVVGINFVVYLVDTVTRSKIAPLRWSSSILQIGIFVFYFLFMIFRYIEVEYPPFRTLYESLVFLCLTTAFIYVIVEQFYRFAILGIVCNIFLLGVMAYAQMNTEIDQTTMPAALQSVWFIPHVLVYFLGYGSLFLAAAMAIIFLIRPQQMLVARNLTKDKEVSFKKLMHNLAILGYVLITVGLVIGAFWAKEAWGNYWTWDPKENWSLITFLIYTIYFHQRRAPKWKDQYSAILLIIGFAAVIFTYLGMSMLPTAEQSIHVYTEG